MLLSHAVEVLVIATSIGSFAEVRAGRNRGWNGKGRLRNLLRAAGFGPAAGRFTRHSGAGGAGMRWGHQLHAA
eukprot:1492939-Pyramimonas_sp.AAC.1